MSKDRDVLINAAEKHKLPQLIVGYLKLQQAKKNDFFALFLQNKINGRLFYNTSLPDGTKEIRYGNEDFLHQDFMNAIDHVLSPFKSVTLEQVKAESVKPGALSSQMRDVIDDFMECIESSPVWKQFWESEIALQSDAAQKKHLYNTVAGAAAYKAFVSCINESHAITDPIVKRNIAALVTLCTNKYESVSLKDSANFSLKNGQDFQIKRKEHDAMGDFMVFKKQKSTSELEQKKLENPTARRKTRKKKNSLATQSALVK